MRALAIVALLAWPLVASADTEPAHDEAEDDEAPVITDDDGDEPTPAELADEVDDLAQRQKKLERAQRTNDETRRELNRMKYLMRFINVYVDVGAFAVAGDGSGIRSDVGHVYYPEYMGKVPGQWVFMGDPLSTAINSQGEPSDTSSSREIAVDTVNSEGHPSVIVNAVGLSIGKDLTHDIAVASLTQLMPRVTSNVLDVQLAEILYRHPVGDGNLRVSAGKIDSVLGIEYRAQDAPVRLGVSPSLICRYTCGRPLGVRAQLVEGAISVSATMTNGNNFQALFEHDSKLKANAAPTASAHVQYLLPVGQGLEVGVSGALGPQDNQPHIDVTQWHIGFDAKLTDLHGFDAAAEYVQGEQEGQTTGMAECDAAPCLTYKGAYLLVARRVQAWVTPYARIDWRDAVHTDGARFVYESHTVRGTVGAHFEMTSRILAKVEYTWNHELGNIPQFANDIVTSSLVVATD
ncbi:MAG TPA: hypothetical protein VMZ53_29030 [Kofleriaceae bacterium]|nr:hypothetical protein [Kofleriaceae bacterium]